MPINPKTGKFYKLSKPSGPGSNYTGKLSQSPPPYADDVDIFEGGPAGQVLIDIDPTYGGIQLQEDELIGDDLSRDLAKFSKGVLEYVSPSEETQQEQADIRQSNQESLAALFSMTGIDPDSFEGKQLAARIRKDKGLQKLMGYDPGGMLTGGGTTDRPTYGLFDIGNFFFGDARKGLTSMVDEGIKYKELPFEQKLGIAILPIDLIDVAGVGYLAKAPIGALMRAGVKTFGKNSKLTVKELVDNPEFMTKYLEQNPNAAKDLEQYGFDIQKRYASGKKKRGPTPIERDTGIETIGRDFLQEQKQQTPTTTIDPNLLEAAKKAEKGKQAEDSSSLTGKYLLRDFQRITKTDPNFKNDETVDLFAQLYEKEFNRIDRAGASRDARFEEKLGVKNYNKLKKLISKKGIKIREMGKGGITLKPEGLNYIRKNNNKKTPDEMLEHLRSNKDKYFYTDRAGDRLDFASLQAFKNYKGKMGFTFGKPSELPLKPGRIKYHNAVETFQKKIAEIEKIGKTEITPELLTNEFKLAVQKAEGLNPNVRLPDKEKLNFQKTLLNRINDYNKTLDADSPYFVLNTRELNALKSGRDIGEKGKTHYENIFSKKFRNSEQYQEALSFLSKGDDTTLASSLDRFFNFIRESTPEYRADVRKFDQFIDEMTPRFKELQNEDSIFRKNFEYFKTVDDARIEMNELTKPFLNQLFKTPAFATRKDGTKVIFDKELFDPDTKSRRSLQIAHRYMGSQIGDSVPKGIAGASEFPQSYTIDVSVINQSIQPKLEKMARNAVAENDIAEMRKIHLDAERFGTAFEVDGIQFGTQKGIADKLEQYLQYVLLRPEKQKEFGITKDMISNVREAINKARSLNREGYNFNKGGLVGDVDDIFEEEDEIMKAKKSIFPRISVEFGDAARGTKRSFGEEKPEDMVDLPLSSVQLDGGPEVFNLEQKTTAAPMQKTFDVQPMEDIFEGEEQQANLKLPFWKLFTKPPVSETAPIPTPKENLNNPTKKQKESLELEKEKKKDEVFDPTPEDNDKVNLVDDVGIAVTPKTNQPITGVFYSDIERVLARPDTPEIFVNKKALLDFFRKNRIRDSEFRDYQIESLLRIYDENTPIPKQQVIQHLRQSPIRGMHVHATGQGSEIINPYGEVGTRYTGYAEPGFISGTQRERVLYIPGDKIAGDSGVYPQSIFSGESVQRHDFGIPQGDNSYIVGWSRLTDRNAILPTKIAAPKTQSKVPGLTRERERAQRQVAGLYAEAINKLNREAVRKGLGQDDINFINQLSLEQMMSDYGDTINQLSPGLMDQMDELIVKVRDLDAEIAKGSNVDTSGIVKVAFADEIQSDIMQAAAGRKQKLVATLRKIQDEGRDSTTLPELSRVGQQALEFFEENKSVFRPLRRTQAEVDIIGERLTKLDAEVDEIINRYIETRELDPASVTRLQEALTENINQMINDLIVIDSKTYDGLFPDIPFKKREEWADALIKKDLFELAYQKFVLKDPNAPDYYSVTPDQFVIDRYNFNGNSATPMDVRAADKKAQIDYFTARGEFKGSEYKGIGMSEFYGGPNAKTPDGKHYTSVIEKILKTQAKSNNSEFTVLNVQTKSGGKDVFIVRDQNGNMVATLTSQEQATRLSQSNPNYKIETLRVPDNKNTTPSFAIKITEEMLEPYKTHKAKGGLVQMIDIFEVA